MNDWWRSNNDDRLPTWLAMLLFIAWGVLVGLAVVFTIITVGLLILHHLS